MPMNYFQLAQLIQWQKEQREKRLQTDEAFRQRVAFKRNRTDLRAAWKKKHKNVIGFKLIMKKQSKWKNAMRYAIKDEVIAFKRKKTLDVLASGQEELARLYRLPGNHVNAYQVGHKKAFVELLGLYLLEKNLCWEDLSMGPLDHLSDSEQIDSWTAWHQSYSETYDNLFVLSKVQNNRASKRWAMMSSRQFGSF